MDNIGKYELSKFYEMLGRIANAVEETTNAIQKLAEHTEEQVKQTDRIENLLVLLTSLKAADHHKVLNHPGTDILGYEVEDMSDEDIRALAENHYLKTKTYDTAQADAEFFARMQATYRGNASNDSDEATNQ